MINVVRPGHTFSNRGLLHPACPDADTPRNSATKPIRIDGITLAKKRIFRTILPKGRYTKDWTTIAWPTNIQSRTPDGKFGPAKQRKGSGDCWFLAALAAVANDQDGQKILAESIKKVSIEGIDGYHVTFAGPPNNTVFISDQALNNCLDADGGDADTRLMELAADEFFAVNGNFRSLFLTIQMLAGKDQQGAERCLQDYCQRSDIQDPMSWNPMFGGGHDVLAFFMLTGMLPDQIMADRDTTLQRSEIMAFLNQYVTNDRDGVSVVINGEENPLGDTPSAEELVIEWDIIRTEITRDGRLRKRQRAFLNALNKWLETPNDNSWQDLQSAAEKLRLQHARPVRFMDLLNRTQISLRQNHRDILRSGVQEVLAGGPGYIGFCGDHCGTIEGINEASNTFTYSEPNHPMLVHTGELSDLIQAVRSGDVYLSAFEPTIWRDDGESSEHAGQKRGRHLRQIHNHVVRDGKIDPTESAPLAGLIEMDDGAFWHAYDSDNNGVIEGGELKAVKLRVDRWVDHFELTPIW